jgi:hypothetical protein
MKKSVTILLVILLAGSVTDGWAQALKKGFSIKAQLGFPSASYGVNEDVEDDYKFGTTYGVQFGNQWYFYKNETLGVGLMVNWADATYTRKKGSTAFGDFDRDALDVAVGEVGPVLSLAVGDPMAIDVYYNLRPTIMAASYEIGGEDLEGFGGFGVTHAFGAGFRFSLLYVGGEYVTGKVKVSQDSTDDDIWMDEKIDVGCFRILAGVKF